MIETAKRLVKRLRIQQLLAIEARKRRGMPVEFDALPPGLWGLRVDAAGHLELDGQDLVDLASEHGTPLHVVNHARLIDDYKTFVGAFRRHLPKVELATSYKTNPVPGVLRALHEAGTWAEVISHFELWLALQLKVPPQCIVLNGPGKGPESVDLAVARGVGLINIDAPDEIPWVVDSARRRGVRQRVGLRVVTTVGWASQFGTRIDNGESLAACREIARHPELIAHGLHLHLGTGIKDVDAYARAIREVLEFAQALRGLLGIEIACFDFGGGFAVPTVRSLDEWDGRMVAIGLPQRVAFPGDCPRPEDYALPIARLIREYHGGPDASLPQILFEPGRAITSSAQTLVLRVLTVKESRSGPAKLILDGGKNITMPLAWETHQIFAAGRLHEPATEVYDLYGPLCHPGDVVARHKRLPRMAAGDVVAIMDAGAYFIPNQMNFSLPRPPVLMVRDGRVQEIRGREQFADIVRLDRLDAAHAPA